MSCGDRDLIQHWLDLTAPSHYLNQCWLLISEFLWHSSESNVTDIAQATILCNTFKYCTDKLLPHSPGVNELTHWGRVTHICVSKQTSIGSDNGIIWTNAGILLIGPFGTSEILMESLTFSIKKMRFKVSSAKRRPFCLGLNEFKYIHSKSEHTKPYLPCSCLPVRRPATCWSSPWGPCCWSRDRTRGVEPSPVRNPPTPSSTALKRGDRDDKIRFRWQLNHAPQLKEIIESRKLVSSSGINFKSLVKRTRAHKPTYVTLLKSSQIWYRNKKAQKKQSTPYYSIDFGIKHPEIIPQQVKDILYFIENQYRFLM